MRGRPQRAWDEALVRNRAFFRRFYGEAAIAAALEGGRDSAISWKRE